MIKPKKLKKGDKVAIVSMSSGILGEEFCSHQLAIGINRLKEYGLTPIFMPNALKGVEFLKNNPRKRAEDLKKAFLDDSIKAIICAIGGEDTYKTLPFLLDDKEFLNSIKIKPKIFTGFSDSTINHLMFYKLGLTTFYGPNFICDLAELDNDMIPYTKKYFDLFFKDLNEIEISSSNLWYNERKNYGPEHVGISRKVNDESYGFEVINGEGIVSGNLLGGCIESIYKMIIRNECKAQSKINNKYNIIPSSKDWKNKIMFLETSDSKSSPENLKIMLEKFKSLGFFNQINGLLIGKPQDEVFYEEYKLIYKSIFKDIDIPIIYNVNFGHSTPRCILPYGLKVEINCNNKKIFIKESIFKL